MCCCSCDGAPGGAATRVPSSTLAARYSSIRLVTARCSSLQLVGTLEAAPPGAPSQEQQHTRNTLETPEQHPEGGAARTVPLRVYSCRGLRFLFIRALLQGVGFKVSFLRAFLHGVKASSYPARTRNLHRNLQSDFCSNLEIFSFSEILVFQVQGTLRRNWQDDFCEIISRLLDFRNDCK